MKFSSFVFTTNNWVSHVYYSDPVITTTGYGYTDFKNELFELNIDTLEQVQKDVELRSTNLKIPINHFMSQNVKRDTSIESELFIKYRRYSRIRSREMFYRYFVSQNPNLELYRENNQHFLKNDQIVVIPYTNLPPEKQYKYIDSTTRIKDIEYRLDELAKKVDLKSKESYERIKQEGVPEEQSLEARLGVRMAKIFLDNLQGKDSGFETVQNIIDTVRRRLGKLEDLSQHYYSKFKQWLELESRYTKTQLNYYEFLKRQIKSDFLDFNTDSTHGEQDTSFQQFVKSMHELELTLYEYVADVRHDAVEDAKIVHYKVKEINETIEKEFTR